MLSRSPKASAISAVVAAPVALAPGSVIADAQQAITANCIAHLAGNIALLCTPGRPEALHQAHVATRRLRTMMLIFRPIVDDAQSADWRRIDADIRHLGRCMGELRDCALLLARSDVPAATVRRLRTASTTGQAAVCAALHDTQFRADLVALLTLPRRRQARADLGEWAGTVLDRLFRQLRRAGRRLGEQPPEQRHRARIRAKRLRYAVEFFASLYPCRKQRRRHRRLVKRLGALQDSLGTLNDFATMERLLGPGHGGSPAELAALTARAEAQLATIGKTSVFWR
jgi:triphosphatase